MDFNYTDLKIEDYSEDVRKKYSFPSSDEIERYTKQEQKLEREQSKFTMRLAKQDFMAIAGGLTIGSIYYMFNKIPSGQVVRDRAYSNMPFPKRALNKTLPIVAVGTAFALAKRTIENFHNSRK